MILIIDNYDSFTHNLWQLVRERSPRGADVQVIRNDALDEAGLAAASPSHVILSPGPGHPADAGLSLMAPDTLPETPILGVCLGHQALALAAGARVTHATHPTHGSAQQAHHVGTGLFSGLANPLDVALYHSLAVDVESLPSCLAITARSENGTIMGLQHRERPHHGVQFHPESFMTADGRNLMDTFLATDSRVPT